MVKLLLQSDFDVNIKNNVSTEFILISVATMHTADIQNSKDANSKCMPKQLYLIITSITVTNSLVQLVVLY